MFFFLFSSPSLFFVFFFCFLFFLSFLLSRYSFQSLFYLLFFLTIKFTGLLKANIRRRRALDLASTRTIGLFASWGMKSGSVAGDATYANDHVDRVGGLPMFDAWGVYSL